MTTQTFEMEHVVTLKAVICCTCGTAYAMEEHLRQQARRDGSTFYCPNGHPQIFSETIESELKKVQQELDWTNRDRNFWKAEAEDTAKRLSTTKGVLTRTKNRIAKGVCPCCHRQFVQLARHMATKHPDYMEAKDE